MCVLQGVRDMCSPETYQSNKNTSVEDMTKVSSNSLLHNMCVLLLFYFNLFINVIVLKFQGY